MPNAYCKIISAHVANLIPLASDLRGLFSRREQLNGWPNPASHNFQTIIGARYTPKVTGRSRQSP
jgi:hypothetical protein